MPVEKQGLVNALFSACFVVICAFVTLTILHNEMQQIMLGKFFGNVFIVFWPGIS